MAVYTEVSAETLCDVLAGYDLGPLVSFKGIAEGVENTNYIVRTQKAQLILTLYEKRVAEQDLPFFIGLMEHLAGRGIPCPVPVHDRSGRVLQSIEGRCAALFTFLEGVSVGRPSVGHCGLVGMVLARMHVAGHGYNQRRDNSLSLAGWAHLAEALRDRADDVAPGLGALIRGEQRWLEDHWPAALPTGLIHADLFPDNVFFLDGDLSGVIDFYFACNDLLAYDIAVCLNAWCFEPDQAFNVTKARYLLEGYSSVRPLGADEIEALPVLARGAALRFLLTRAYDWFNTAPQAIVRPKDPREYWRKLRFHQKVVSAREYGF
jgi:homoserine kinase type II